MTDTAPAAAARARGRVQPPRTWSVRPGDVIAAVALNAVVIVGMWVRHGGVGLLGPPSADLTAVGQLTALLGTYAALVQVVLMSRSPWLEQLFGMDGLARWHRRLGFLCTVTICAHVVFTTLGYAVADGTSIAAETWTLLTVYPYVLMATVATGFLITVAVTSMRAARRRLKYETWHFVHLYGYLAIVLSFGHTLAVGTDLSTDPVARAYWVALYFVALACMVVFRIGRPVRMGLRHDLRVSKVVPEARNVVSVYITGRDLGELRARGGQFFTWRFLAGDGWWKAHPFSLSARPNGQFLRITVKLVGDGTTAVHRLQPGTRVVAEGPYGIFTTLRRTKSRALLVAAGIGITPLRALLEELPGGKESIVLLYRASTWDDVVFRTELEQLMASRGGKLFFLVGRRGSSDIPADPLSARALRDMVPDIMQRDVFVCGPPAMMRGLHTALTVLGLPDTQIHYENFALL